MKIDNKEILKVLQGISQVMGRAYDGALGKDGKPIKIGLRREVDDPIIQTRMMDGFNIKLLQNKLFINYSSEITIEEMHNDKWEDEIEQIFEDIVKFLKKEYKSIMKSSLKLKKIDKTNILVQNINRRRTQVNATAKYEIGGLPSGKDQSKDSNREELDKAVKKFLSQGKGGNFSEK